MTDHNKTEGPVLPQGACSRDAMHSPRNYLLGWIHGLSLAGLTVFGLLLRLRHLGTPSLWMDEGATAAIASLNWPSFWKLIFSREMNMSVYYCILRVFPFLQHSEWLLRLPSVVFGVGVIAAAWLLAKQLWEDDQETVPLGSASLIAVNGFMVAYSQEARGYAMAVCLLVLSSWAAMVMLKTQKLRGTWCLLALGAVYSHVYTVLWIIPQIWAVWRVHRRLGWEFFRKIVVIGGIGLIPLLVFVFRTRGGQLDWVPKLTPHSLLAMFVQIAGYSYVALALLSTGSAFGCLKLWRRGDVLARLVVLENVIPILALLALSPIHSVFVPRFLIFAIPFLIITATVGLANLRNPWGPLTLVSLWIAMLVVGNRSPAKGDWRSMTQYLCLEPQRAVAFWPPMQRLPYWYYSRSNPTCPKPLSSDTREPSLADFAGDKREFADRLCSSERQSIVMVMESDWQKRFPTTVTKCFVPASVTVRDGLQLIRLERIAPIQAVELPKD